MMETAGEFGFIDWLRRRTPLDRRVLVGPGDDTAVLSVPGDRMFVTGPLGGSILGHHLDFTPRVREALLLHQAVDLHAMIDISDGLARDAWHICEESGCGAVLHAGAIPITEAALQMKDDK